MMIFVFFWGGCFTISQNASKDIYILIDFRCFFDVSFRKCFSTCGLIKRLYSFC